MLGYNHLPTNGRDFEEYLRELFVDLGYKVDLTPLSNDYGADLILTDSRTNTRIAVQAKFHGKPLGNTPVQEVVTALAYYHAQQGWVVTNSTFTQNATDLAKANGVRLIDGIELNQLVQKAQRFSGLDIMVDNPPVANAAQRRPQRIENTLPPQINSINVPQPVLQVRIFNLSEVAIRWNCSQGKVHKEIALGMPMRKQPNGRWAISEIDLMRWERMVQSEHEMAEQKRRQSTGTALVVFFIIVLTVAGFIAYCILVKNPFSFLL
jgi:hypothetical protein